ncbi:MAG TPA: hypothetical protein VEO00_02565 [Actinomycetota bacterium]|nr:hypothetical protein [Actinomycetota bacterium]
MVGFLWGRRRRRDPLDNPPFLAIAHRMGLWGGFMLLGLVWAVQLSDLSSGLEIVAASLLVASSVFQDVGAVLNWTLGVKDQFAEHSLGLRFGTANSVFGTAGLAILLIGVVRAL